MRIDVAADYADPADLLLTVCLLLLGLRLDVLEVVAVADRGSFAQDLAVGDLSDEQSMAAEVNALHNLGGKVGVRALGDVGDAVCRKLVLELLELVDIPAALIAKVLEGREV